MVSERLRLLRSHHPLRVESQARPSRRSHATSSDPHPENRREIHSAREVRLASRSQVCLAGEPSGATGSRSSLCVSSTSLSRRAELTFSLDADVLNCLAMSPIEVLHDKYLKQVTTLLEQLEAVSSPAEYGQSGDECIDGLSCPSSLRRFAR